MTQGYHPHGILAYPDEATIRSDLEQARRLGFDMVRAHVKVEDPRFLAWADRLGILVWSEVPNFLAGAPAARARWERTWRGMIERDAGHPSVALWCMFIESWGLGTDQFGFGRAERPFAEDPEAQAWVTSMYRLGRSLDPTRPIIENSVSEADHTCAEVNDIHLFPTGYGEVQETAASALDEYVANAYPGSGHNFARGWSQGDQPLMVTSMAGWSSVDGVETSWPMLSLVNEVRAREAIAGYGWVQLYDVEWELTGLATYDRRPKDFGYDVAALHAEDCLVVRGPLARAVLPGSRVAIEVALAHASGRIVGDIGLRATASGVDRHGRQVRGEPVSAPWTVTVRRRGVMPMGEIAVALPAGPFAGRVDLEATAADGRVVARSLVLVSTGPAEASGPGRDLPLEAWRPVGESMSRRVSSHIEWLEAPALECVVRVSGGSGPFALEAEGAVRSGPPGQTRLGQSDVDVRVSLDGRVVSVTPFPTLRADTRGVLSIVEPVGEGGYGTWFRVDLGGLDDGRDHVLRLVVGDGHPGANVILFGSHLGSVPAGPRLIAGRTHGRRSLGPS
jgi:hypothetical protein